MERGCWLALVCLPLLTGGVSVRADILAAAPEDWLTVWQTFSDAARQAPPDETVPTDPLSALLRPQSPAGGTPRLLPLAPSLPDLGVDLSPGDGGDARPSGPWELPNRKPQKISQKSDVLLGSVNAQVEVTDAPTPRVWDEPAWKRTWQTDDSWQMSLAGPLSVFGQVGANGDEVMQSNMKLSGRTGLACKVPVGSLAEFTFRSGPGVSYTDPLHLARTQGRSDWLVEVQARWPLLFGIGLEYQGTANPSLTPLQQDTVNQDVRLAFPLGGAGKLKVGAKHQWTGVLDQRTPWTDSMQVYLGLELNH